MNRLVCVPRASTVISAALAIIIAAAVGPLVRLIAIAGDLDPSFGIGGVATAPSSQFASATAIAVQADGKILAAGYGERVLARFNPDGSLDSGFGTGGRAGIPLTSGYYAFEILLRPDGRIVVAAESSTSKATMVQYDADGTLDTTFGNGGIAVDNTAHNIWRSRAAALQADGSILFVGHGYFNIVDTYDFTVLKFTAGGAIDTTFGSAGLVRTDIIGGEQAHAIAVQADGRFVVAGFADGRLQPDGSYLRRQFAFVRYLPDGTLDTSFGTGGKVNVDPAYGQGYESWLHDLLVQPDGRVVGAGFSSLSLGSRSLGAVVRLLPDGQLDTSFAEDGIALFDDFHYLEASGWLGVAIRGGIGRIALQSNGRLLAAGGSNTVIGVTPDGTLDPEFHGDGRVSLPGPTFDMTVQDDNKPLIGSGQSGVHQPGFKVFRLVAENTPPALTPAAITVQRGTSPRLTIGTAVDASDPLANLVVAPVAGTVPAGLTLSNLVVDAATGAVSAVAAASCTAATGLFDVQFSITDGGNVTTFATVPVEVLVNTGPFLSVADRTHVEGHSFQTTAVVTVTASGGVCEPLTVQYATANGTATTPADYSARTGTASIAIGQSSTTIPIPVAGDSLPEFDETLFVNLDSPINATIEDGQGVVTIQDDDPPFIQFAPPTTVDVIEKDDPALTDVVTLRLTRQTRLHLYSYVRVTLLGTALAGGDYVLLTPQVVTFVSGQTEAEVRIAIIGDAIEEPLESVTVSIDQPANATIGSPSNVRIFITDDDGAPSDPDAPIIAGSVPVAPNAAGWHHADVSVALSASDGTGSGVESISYALSGAQASALIVVPAASTSVPIVTEGITVVTFFAEDVAGNVSASQSLTVRLDKTAPGVVITSPEGRPYTRNEVAAASYACTDGGSGVASCAGTTAVGAPLDTASTGPQSYSVTATDAAGNQATASVAYTVVVPPPTFTIRALYDPLEEHTRNSAIPIRLRVENAAGLNVSSAGLVVEALAVSSGTAIGPAEEELPADDAGQSNPLGRFRFVGDGAYLFNLKTTGLASGPYVLVVRVAGDPSLHAMPFRIRVP